MSKIRVLVGTKKGAFVLTADGKREQWDVSGPHFAGWEMYHVKGSPADDGPRIHGAGGGLDNQVGLKAVRQDRPRPSLVSAKHATGRQYQGSFHVISLPSSSYTVGHATSVPQT